MTHAQSSADTGYMDSFLVVFLLGACSCSEEGLASDNMGIGIQAAAVSINHFTPEAALLKERWHPDANTDSYKQYQVTDKPL